MMKKILSLVLVTVLVLSMAACSKDETQVTNEITNETTNETTDTVDTTDEASATVAPVDFTGKTVTVGIWGGNDSEATALAQVISDFEAKTGAKVETKTYTDINTQLQADFIAGTAPDVFYVDANVFPFYATLDVLQELDPVEMSTDSYYSNLISAFTTVDGKVYAIPKDMSTLAMYVNTGLLEEVGYTVADVPTSLEDMVTFLPELQAKLDEKYGKDQVVAMTYNQDMARNLHLLERNGASIIDADEMATLSSTGIVDNFKFMMNLINTGAYKTPAEIGVGWNGEAFGSGKCVIMEEGNWVYGELLLNYPDVNFEVLDMPTYLGEKSSMTFTVGYALSANASEPELAKEWIRYATGEGMVTWCTGAKTLPSRADVAETMNLSSDPIWTTHLNQIDYARSWQKGTTISIINSAYQNFFPSIVSGELTPEEGLLKIDQLANEEITNSR
jgi:multiple sugar transport system substrate-binding protein